MLLSEVFNNYLRDVVLFSGQSNSTAGHVKRTRDRIISTLGDIEISLLSFEDIVRFKSKVEQTCGRNGTRQFIIKLRNVLRYCRQHGITCIDYDSIKLPKAETTHVSFCTPDEVKRMIDATSKTKITLHKIRDRAIISLLYASGLRLSELCGLNIDQITSDRKFTVIGKNGKMRLCFFDEQTYRYLSEYIKARREGYKTYYVYKGKVSKEVRRYYPPDTNEALFTNCITGKRIQAQGVQLLMKNVAREAGITKNVHPHMLRHSFCTRLIENGMAIHDVAYMAGHTSIATTSVYLNVTYPQMQDKYERYFSI